MKNKSIERSWFALDFLGGLGMGVVLVCVWDWKYHSFIHLEASERIMLLMLGNRKIV